MITNTNKLKGLYVVQLLKPDVKNEKPHVKCIIWHGENSLSKLLMTVYVNKCIGGGVSSIFCNKNNENYK